MKYGVLQYLDMGVQLSKTSHKILFLILIPLLSTGIALLLNTWLQANIAAPWILLIDSFGVLGIYGIIFQIFDKSLWQIFPQGFLGIVDVPNLNGSWTGDLKSSYDNNTTPYKTRVEIIQTFSNIKVFSYFQKSWSSSIVADFQTENDGRKVLHYIYKNEPYSNAAPTMHGHYGASKHEYLKNKEQMKCSYYNEPPRERGHYGTYDVKRKKRSLKRKLFPTLLQEFKS